MHAEAACHNAAKLPYSCSIPKHIWITGTSTNEGSTMRLELTQGSPRDGIVSSKAQPPQHILSYHIGPKHIVCCLSNQSHSISHKHIVSANRQPRTQSLIPHSVTYSHHTTSNFMTELPGHLQSLLICQQIVGLHLVCNNMGPLEKAGPIRITIIKFHDGPHSKRWRGPYIVVLKLSVALACVCVSVTLCLLSIYFSDFRYFLLLCKLFHVQYNTFRLDMLWGMP